MLFSAMAASPHPTSTGQSPPFPRSLTSTYLLSFLTGARHHLTEVWLAFISLMVSDGEPLATHLMAICVSSLGKCPFGSSVQFSMGYYLFIYCYCLMLAPWA